MAWARTLPTQALALAVCEGNAHAAALYLRHGFVDAGPLPAEHAFAPAERRMILSLRAGS